MGPPIGMRLARLDDQHLTELIHNGIPARGMPPNHVEGADLTNLISFSRTLQRRGRRGPVAKTVTLTSGKTVDGLVLGEGFDDLQLQTKDTRVLLLRRAGASYREVTSDTDWPTYNGETGGNRFTSLTQINKQNIAQLSAKWTFPIPNAGLLQATPAVVGGIMYITAPNFCYALDAGTGRQIWRYEVPRTPEQAKNSGPNRGVGIAGDRVFMETYAAHLIALNRFTGELLWDSRDRGPEAELFRDLRAASRGGLGDFRRGRRANTARMVSSRRSSEYRQRGMAFLKRAEAW